jgi:nicotinate-nucleotide adenylyltransferase
LNVRVPDARISSTELDREGPSYTVDTLRALREEASRHQRIKASREGHRVGRRPPADSPQAQTEFYLLIGADQALDFHRWKEWQQILTLATPVVMLRPPWDEKTFRQELLKRYSPTEVEHWLSWTLTRGLPRLDISASEIRQQLKEGNFAALDGVMDPAVMQYIRENGLYRA